MKKMTSVKVVIKLHTRSVDLRNDEKIGDESADECVEGRGQM